MTIFRKVDWERQFVEVWDAASVSTERLFLCGAPDPSDKILGKCDAQIQFMIGGYQPRIENAFTPPAENIHAHNVAGKPGFDARCKPADPVPARFSAICPKCGQGWYYEATEADLRVSPEMILAGIAAKLDETLKEAIPNPALRMAVGNQIGLKAQKVLRELGLPALLAEIPARGATRAQEEFCARFIPE